VGSAVFKTVSRALVPFWVGSIPMHLRQSSSSILVYGPVRNPTRIVADIQALTGSSLLPLASTHFEETCSWMKL
jgi:hypothetical protein